jgi:hypothetical protein
LFNWRAITDTSFPIEDSAPLPFETQGIASNFIVNFLCKKKESRRKSKATIMHFKLNFNCNIIDENCSSTITPVVK